MPLSRRAPRPAALAVLAIFAVIALHGCGPFDEATSTGPTSPTGPTAFATAMLDAHNAVRADPASVRGSPAPSPALAPLSWSESAAATAQAWADGCTWAHNSGRGHLGENIAAAAPPGSSTATSVVHDMWAGEAQFYDYATNTCDTGQVCGHYTQLVWRSTTAVGCGFKTCTTGSPWGSGSWDFWVCDYAPPGNYVGQRPY